MWPLRVAIQRWENAFLSPSRWSVASRGIAVIAARAPAGVARCSKVGRRGEIMVGRCACASFVWGGGGSLLSLQLRLALMCVFVPGCALLRLCPLLRAAVWGQLCSFSSLSFLSLLLPCFSGCPLCSSFVGCSSSRGWSLFLCCSSFLRWSPLLSWTPSVR